jgi:chromosome segregation ATPase
MTDRLDRIENILAALADRLDRTESSLERTEAIANSNARAIEATNNALDTKFNQIADAVIRGQDRLERLERRDRRYQAEIRGLRIETRRILERWLGEPFTDDPDLDDDEDTPA